MRRRLPKEEANSIRVSGLDLTDRHLQIRLLVRLDMHKVKKIFEEGEMYQIGKHKFRSVLRFDSTTAYLIFERTFDNNVLRTVGITRSKRGRWD